MPSERAKSGQSRERLAGLLLDTLEFGQARGRASEVTVVALRVSDSIRRLAIDILEDPSTVNTLITDWQKSVKKPKSPGAATVEDNASTIHQKSAGRGDFEARVLALYRALDGDVYDKSTKITANVRRTKASTTNATTTTTTGGIAASTRVADHRDHLRRARLLLDAVIAEDKHIHNRVAEKARKGQKEGGIPAAVQAVYMDKSKMQLYNTINIALQQIKDREDLWGSRESVGLAKKSLVQP